MKQEANRIATCDILVGINGAGKTTYLKNNIVDVLSRKGKRILIVTNADNTDWLNIETLNSYKELETFTGIRKMIYKKGRLEKIQQHYSKGALILDDCRLYIQLQTTDFMNWLQVLRRHVVEYLIDRENRKLKSENWEIVENIDKFKLRFKNIKKRNK